MAVQYAFSQITTTGLKLAVDAADPLSYPGSGTTWTDVTGNGFTGTISSSISFATTNRGALVSSNSASAVSFSGSAADFGSGSFTIEMAFSPSQINGRHWLYSKNSGSFPNFGAYITGSSGSGRIVAFYNISSTVSSSATTAVSSIVTGSNYVLDVTYVPNSFFTGVYLNSNLQNTSGANGTGSLSTSASLLLLNNTTASSAGTMGNLYNFKVYNPLINSANIRKNYNSMCSRFGLPLALYTPPAPLLLDLYPGAAAAYSLRRLSDFYGGAAIRVRRSSDNTEQDVGFDGDRNLNTGALLTFCGAGDGFVTTWYDQSGNGRHLYQSTAADQPQIVSTGTIISDGNRPTIRFESSQRLRTNLLSPTIAYNSGDSQSVIGVFKFNNFLLGSFGRLFTQASSSYISSTQQDYNAPGNYIPFLQNSTMSQVGQYQTGSFRNLTSISLSTSYLYTSIQSSGTSLSLTINNDVTSTTNISSPFFAGGVGYLQIGAGLTSLVNEKLYANIPEVINYMSDQTPNLDGIRSNINSYYSIY